MEHQTDRRRSSQSPSDLSDQARALIISDEHTSGEDKLQVLRSRPASPHAIYGAPRSIQVRRVSLDERHLGSISEPVEHHNLSRDSLEDTDDMRSFTKLNEAEERVTYTPTTHRISKAKKGKPVHYCSECGKIFTRAEHLRRHQMNHSTDARYKCEVTGCNKEFKRADLLKRHHERHNETQGNGTPPPSLSASSSRRPSSAYLDESRRPSSTFSVSSIGSVPTTSMQGSPNLYDPQMLAPTGQVPMPFLDTPVEPPTPNGPGPVSSQTLNASLLSPLCIPTTSSSSAGGYVPDLSYGPSDESPLHSSASSCYSADFPGSRYAPTQMYGISPRGRSDSTMSAPESSYWAPKSRLGMSEADSLGAWSVEETLPSQPAPYVMSTGGGVGGTGGAYDGAFLPSVGTPPPRERTLQGRAQSLSAFSPSPHQPATIPVAHLSGNSVAELRHLMVGPLDISMDLHGVAVHIMTTRLDAYLDLYWRHFDPVVPVVHRASFSSRTSEPVLVAIMSAIGAQYARTPDARQLAVAVHQRCKDALLHKSGPITTRSPLPVIQCAVLLEHFGIFRSKRADVELSPQFKTLYSSLFEDRNRRNADPLARLRSARSSAASDLRYEWLRWVDLEARRRLVLACFILDAQQAVLFEQDFSQSPALRGHSSLFVSCPPAIWEAGSPADWTSHHGGLSNLLPQRRLPDMAREFLNPSPAVSTATSTAPQSYSTFESSTVLAYIMSSTQSPDHISIIESRLAHWLTRVKAVCPSSGVRHPLLATYHTYHLSLHTPLRSLLAVTGESWVLGRKLSHPSEFLNARMQVQQWASGASAKRAAWHAARVVRCAMARQDAVDGDGENEKQGGGLHEQWCVYVSALVCWAWGSALRRSSVPSPRQEGAEGEAGEVESMWRYLYAMDTQSWEDVGGTVETAGRVAMTKGLLGCVRRWTRGSMCGLLKEGEAVLKRIEGGGVVERGF